MLYDELIQKHLDGELDDSGLTELQNLVKTDPDFADSVSGMENIETSLNAFKTQLTEHDDIFIRDFGATLITATTAVGGASLGSNAQLANTAGNSLKHFLITKKLFLSGILIVALTGSYFLFNNVNSAGTTVNTKSPALIKKSQNQTQVPQIAQETQVNQSETKNEKNIPASSQQTQAVGNSNKPLVKDELELSVKEKNNQKNLELINKLKVTLDDYSAKGDILNSALTAKRLGVLYRQLDGYENESLNQFQRALKMSEESRNQLMKAEVLGELSLLYFKTNQNDLGDKTLKQCIDLMNELASPRAEYWQKVKSKF